MITFFELHLKNMLGITSIALLYLVIETFVLRIRPDLLSENLIFIAKIAIKILTLTKICFADIYRDISGILSSA